MKIVIAPDSFKESLSASEVAACIEQGFRDIFPDAHYVILPMADGGEGTVDAMVTATVGKRVMHTVSGPRGETVNAFYGLSGSRRCAFIEMAAASGLALLPVSQRNPLITSSRGTGELITHALDAGVEHIIIGIGGSATNDGGAGMLQALGVALLDKQGQSLPPGGQALAQLAHIDMTMFDTRIQRCCIDVACDVTHCLTGPEGASAVFGPQKGATPERVKILDDALDHFADVILRDLHKEVRSLPGGGAAGGMGAALSAFCGAALRPGIDIVAGALNLDAQLRDADVIITGEGRMDSQSIHGKVPSGVARIAKRYNKPVVVIAGSLATDAGAMYQHGVEAMFSVVGGVCSLDEALRNAANNVRQTARNIAAAFAIGQTLS